jgi:hypothetical protein
MYEDYYLCAVIINNKTMESAFNDKLKTKYVISFSDADIFHGDHLDFSSLMEVFNAQKLQINVLLLPEFFYVLIHTSTM